MLKLSRPLFILSATLLALSACATSSQLHAHSASSGAWKGTAILLNYDLATTDEDTLRNGCTLVLHNSSRDTDTWIDLPGREHHVLMDAPSGDYQWRNLSCPHLARWDLGSLARASFKAKEGRINYLGRIEFKISKDYSSMVVKYSDQGQATQALAIDFKSIPESWQSALENPYTSKEITHEMLEPKGIYRMNVHFVRATKEGETPASVAPLEASLRTCDMEEQKRFPYRLGSLNYVARYENGVLKDLTHEGQNSFSDEFLTCLEQAFHGFGPPNSANLKVTVSL